MGEGHILGNLGLTYARLGDAGRAIGYQEQRLGIAREIGGRREEGAALGNMGNVYGQLGDARRAIGYHIEALEIAREIGNRRAEGLRWVTWAMPTPKLATPVGPSATTSRHLRSPVRAGTGRRGARPDELGNACAALGDAQGAVELWQRATAILEEIGDAMNAAGVALNLAGLLVQQGKYTEALPHARRAVQAFVQIGHAQYAQQAQQLLTQIQAALR